MKEPRLHRPIFEAHRKKPWYLRSSFQITGMVALVVLLAIVAFTNYRSIFGGPISTNPDDWAVFSGFVSAISSASIGLVTVFLAWKVPHTIQERSDRTQQQINVTTAYSRFYSYDHYIQVICPMWDVVQKWLYLPDDSEGTRYRLQVFGAQFISIHKTQDCAASLFEHPFNNTLGKQNHLENFGTDERQNMVNEHMILSMFHSFWRDIEHDIEREALDRGDVCSKLKDMYSHYRIIFQQLWMVSAYLSTNSTILHYMYQDEIPTKPGEGYFDFYYLDKVMFSSEDQTKYNDEFETNRTRAKALAKIFELELVNWLPKGKSDGKS